jgi:hypothetical protein
MSRMTPDVRHRSIRAVQGLTLWLNGASVEKVEVGEGGVEEMHKSGEDVMDKGGELVVD